MKLSYDTTEDKVRRFHRVMGLAIDEPITPRLLGLRLRLLAEEIAEVSYAMGDAADELKSSGKITTSTKAEMLKELMDLQYVLDGLLVSFGWDGKKEAAFNRVHDSNMSKLGTDGRPIYDEGGKVLKGPNYKPPFLEDLV